MVSTQITRIKNQVSSQKLIIDNICGFLEISPEATGGTQLEINKINLDNIFANLTWEDPAVIGTTLSLVQSYSAIKNGTLLEVQ